MIRLKLNLYDYSNAYIFVSGTITITGKEDDDAARRVDGIEKKVIFKNYVSITNCISSINITQIYNAEDIGVMPMYTLIEYSDNYSKTSENLWKFFKDEPNGNITGSGSFKSKIKITEKTCDNGNAKNVEILVPLKYSSDFWRTLEMPLINCDISIDLTWSNKCVISSAAGEEKFKITDIKPYIPVVPLPAEDNVKLLKQLKSGFKKQLIEKNILN